MKIENKILRKLKGIKVRNMTSGKGNNIPNQFIIETPEGEVFQSYDAIVAIKAPGVILLDSYYWDYSVTTGKYRNIFLGEPKSVTIQKIATGTYKLRDLNG